MIIQYNKIITLSASKIADNATAMPFAQALPSVSKYPPPRVPTLPLKVRSLS